MPGRAIGMPPQVQVRRTAEYGLIITAWQPLAPEASGAPSPGTNEQVIAWTWRSRWAMKSKAETARKIAPSRAKIPMASQRPSPGRFMGKPSLPCHGWSATPSARTGAPGAAAGPESSVGWYHRPARPVESRELRASICPSDVSAASEKTGRGRGPGPGPGPGAQQVTLACTEPCAGPALQRRRAPAKLRRPGPRPGPGPGPGPGRGVALDCATGPSPRRSGSRR